MVRISDLGTQGWEERLWDHLCALDLPFLFFGVGWGVGRAVEGMEEVSSFPGQDLLGFFH